MKRFFCLALFLCTFFFTSCLIHLGSLSDPIIIEGKLYVFIENCDTEYRLLYQKGSNNVYLTPCEERGTKRELYEKFPATAFGSALKKSVVDDKIINTVLYDFEMGGIYSGIIPIPYTLTFYSSEESGDALASVKGSLILGDLITVHEETFDTNLGRIHVLMDTKMKVGRPLI